MRRGPDAALDFYLPVAAVKLKLITRHLGHETSTMSTYVAKDYRLKLFYWRTARDI